MSLLTVSSERRRDIAGEKCSCVGRENETEKKLNAKDPQSLETFNLQSLKPHVLPQVP